MKKSYKLLVDRFDYKEGEVVYQFNSHDYGLARDDTIVTGVYHICVTTDPDGGYPFFTIPFEDVEAV